MSVIWAWVWLFVWLREIAERLRKAWRKTEEEDTGEGNSGVVQR